MCFWLCIHCTIFVFEYPTQIFSLSISIIFYRYINRFLCRQTRYNAYNNPSKDIETVGKEEKYTFIKRWCSKIANYLIYSYLEVEMAWLGRVGLIGVVVVLVGAVLVVIHLAPVSLSSLLTYVSLSRLCALVNYGTLSLHNAKRNAQSLHLDGTLSLHVVKRNA